MKKIGINIDLNLKEILRELLNAEFYPVESIVKYEIEGIDAVILDLKYEKDDDKLHYFSRKNIPVVLLCSREDDFRRITKLFKRKEIYDCIYRDEYFEIEKSLDELFDKKENPKNTSEIVINDTFYKAIVKVDEIIYLDYCRISRRTEITTKCGKVYSLKKGFAEVEYKLKVLDCFIKVDRGTLINKRLLKEIDYKNEKITFKGEKTLSVSRAKLKILEENLDLFRNRIEL
ncbi:LytTR family transcriptional regulator DNA-binding domain-containing protein [Candidatus Cetobacterium colombiensis]|uniref:LytTR family transcriptional regulator DNA-binding domain-containing protein n=1 Tax=Candidatus Cetobacterium colombiensis TaxID=3073100 RepID=A0ABU4WBY3_9FUSO|nr:LytTR family transcriptional regulator DNA-binding domain-containing protein [Candidatus Cetobacterium colombiensis]MDX8335875.1 LytTR family transcriptional regulator DNA-binding domain-containing protein [Candidatus Cetobacterium colombiensis]